VARHSDVDIVVAAIVGSAGLQSTWAALEAGKQPRFTMASTGMEVEVTSFDGDSLGIERKGMKMQFPFARLKDGDLKALAEALQ